MKKLLLIFILIVNSSFAMTDYLYGEEGNYIQIVSNEKRISFNYCDHFGCRFLGNKEGYSLKKLRKISSTEGKYCPINGKTYLVVGALAGVLGAVAGGGITSSILSTLKWAGLGSLLGLSSVIWAHAETLDYQLTEEEIDILRAILKNHGNVETYDNTLSYAVQLDRILKKII